MIVDPSLSSNPGACTFPAQNAMSGGSFIGENIVLFSFLLLMTIVLATLIDKVRFQAQPQRITKPTLGHRVPEFSYFANQASVIFLFLAAWTLYHVMSNCYCVSFLFRSLAFRGCRPRARL
jgi:hypothetical protein